ncbi:RluA family pseudouridine synthase [Deltaproteobacteria bacterium TL4]
MPIFCRMTSSFTHKVTESESGSRIDRVLSTLKEISSRVEGQRLLKEGWITVNQQHVSPAKKLCKNDVIEISMPPPEPLEINPEAGDLEILFEDSEVIVINKSPGVVVHPAPGHTSGTLVNYLLHHCHDLSGIGGVLRPGIVHRLDKDTSGALVIAKTDQAHQHLAKQFHEHTIHRIYKALVWGFPPTAKGTVDAALGRHPQNRKLRAITEQGKSAVTHWTVLERLKHWTLLACQLETGRTHQIRVHMASIKLPIVGDMQYGRSKTNRFQHFSEPVAEVLNHFQRQALHAERLGFVHPVTKQNLEFFASWPNDFQHLLEVLRTEP